MFEKFTLLNVFKKNLFLGLVSLQVHRFSAVFRGQCPVTVYNSRYKVEGCLVTGVLKCVENYQHNNICIRSTSWLVRDHGQDLIQSPAHHFAAVPPYGLSTVCWEGRPGAVSPAGENPSFVQARLVVGSVTGHVQRNGHLGDSVLVWNRYVSSFMASKTLKYIAESVC